jgi:transposase-like protein
MSPNVTDSPENRMNVHNNARLTPRGRDAMVRAVVDQGSTKAEAAQRFNASPKTVAKWVRRFRAEGLGGLRDRSSRPLSLPSQTPPQLAMRSKPCAGSAAPKPPSQPRRACHNRPSAASLDGAA